MKDPDINDLRSKLKRKNNTNRRVDNDFSSRLAPNDHIGSKESGSKESVTKSPVHHKRKKRLIKAKSELKKSLRNKRNTQSKENKASPKQKILNYKLKKVHLLFLAFSLLLLLLISAIVYMFTSMSDVKDININGNQLLSDEEILSRLEISTKDKMITANLSESQHNLELLPIIDNVSIKREWWNTINISINEYETVGFLQQENQHYPILENKRVLRGYNVSPKGAPILYYFQGEEFDGIVESLRNMEPVIRDSISEIYFRPAEESKLRIHMFMNDGQEIVADYSTIGEKMSYYMDMRNQVDPTEGIIDLEVGNSFIPFSSNEAIGVKRNIYSEPTQAEYIEEVDKIINSLKKSFREFGQIDE